jgi:hypothetical protein
MFTNPQPCMIGQVGQYRTGFKDTEVENTKKDLRKFSYIGMYGTHRLNMESDLQSLFGLRVT